MVYWGGYPDHRVKPENPGLQRHVKRPDYALGPHVASLGLAFAADSRLGGQFINGAFMGQHGSWNREPLSGYKVVYVPFGDKGFPAKGVEPVDLLTGFLTADRAMPGRPVGVIFDAERRAAGRGRRREHDLALECAAGRARHSGSVTRVGDLGGSGFAGKLRGEIVGPVALNRLVRRHLRGTRRVEVVHPIDGVVGEQRAAAAAKREEADCPQRDVADAAAFLGAADQNRTWKM